MAIAKVANCSEIYSTDADLRSLATRIGMKAITLTDLDVPSEQLALFASGEAEAGEGSARIQPIRAPQPEVPADSNDVPHQPGEDESR